MVNVNWALIKSLIVSQLQSTGCLTKKIEDKVWDFPPVRGGQGQNNIFATPVQNYYKRNLHKRTC